MLEKKKKFDWFKCFNETLVYAGLGFLIVSFIYGLLGSAHYLALHTEFGSLAYRIFVYFATGCALLIIYILSEAMRKILLKRGLKND